MIDLRITIKMAMRIAHDADVSDPENLAGDMLLLALLAMRAGRVKAPTRKVLVLARREAMGRLRRGDCRAHEVLVEEHHPVEERRIDEHVWSVRRLQALWPDLTAVEREAMLRLLSGEDFTRADGALSNAKRNVLQMLRGEKTRNPKYVTCGHSGHRLQREASNG